MQDFTRLKVWHKAHTLALDIYRATERFPRRDGLALSAQLRRASLSIAANIAEGAGKPSDAEFRRYLQIALGSASETRNHLMVTHGLGLIDDPSYEQLVARIVEIRRMLCGLARRLTEGAAQPGE